jgi:hypothetical protein
MYQYSGQTIAAAVTIGDAPDIIVVASVQPKQRNLDVIAVYFGGSISDDGYHRDVPPTRSIYLPSYQDTLFIYVESLDTSWM